MTSPHPPRPQNFTAAAAINEETLHLPITTPGHVVSPPGVPRTAPNPYPQRPAFRTPGPPASPPPAQPSATGAYPRQAAPARWEGPGYRTDVQGLRAIAVLLVLLSHAGFSFVEGGFVGVDVFFVVSGFLITSLLVKEAFDTGKVSIAGFYARRARRILPAASLVTIATVAGAWLWFPITRIEAVMQDAFTVIVYVVNYRFIAEQSEYLNADQMPSPFQQFWSLAVEEQFYVLWPLLLLGLLFLVRKDPRRLVGVATGVAAAILAVSLILSVFVTERAETTAYYAVHTRAWELAAGSIVALSLPMLKRLPPALAWVLGIGGLASVLAAGVMYTKDTPFPGYTALLPVLGTAAVIAAGTAAGRNPVTSLLGTGPFQFVGRISYSLYLWHWPVLILIPLALDAEPSILLNVVLLVGAFALAQLSYRYVEEPIRRGKFKAANLWGLGTGVVCSVAGIAVIVLLTAVFPKTLPAADPAEQEAVEEIQENDELTEMEQRLAAAIATTTLPADLKPSLEDVEFDLPSIYEGKDESCHLDFDRTQWPDGCEFGDKNSDTVVYLVGDSHAAQWFPALEVVAEQQGWKLVTRTKSSCTPVSVTVDHPDSERDYTECDEARSNVFDEIERVRPAMVVFGSSETTSLAGVDNDSTTEPWLSGWEDTIASVDGAGQVVAFADTPWADDPVPDCVGLHPDDLTECNIDEGDGIRRSDRREAAIELQEGSGVTVIDPTGWLCYEGTCPVVVDGILVYRDSNHLTTPYVDSLAGSLKELLPAL